MSQVEIWLVIAGMGALTFLLRHSFIGIVAHGDIPPGVRHALRFVPAAVMTALVMPQLFPHGAEGIAPDQAKIFAALAATAIAWKTRNTLFTLAGGMAALWTLQFIMP